LLSSKQEEQEQEQEEEHCLVLPPSCFHAPSSCHQQALRRLPVAGCRMGWRPGAAPPPRGPRPANYRLG
jgi:hypothetical protein